MIRGFRFQVASANTNEFVDSDSAYSDTNWHYIVGVHRGDTFYLYVDGVEQTATGTRAIEESGNDFRIGRQYYDYDNRWWDGIIDEARISNMSRSAAWTTNLEETIWLILEAKKVEILIGFHT